MNWIVFVFNIKNLLFKYVWNILINYINYVYWSILKNKNKSKLTSGWNLIASENRSSLFSWMAGFFLTFIFKSSDFRLFIHVEIQSDSTQNEAKHPDVPRSQTPPLSFPKRRFRENTCVCGSWLRQTLKNTSLRPQLDDSVPFQKDLKTRTSLHPR